MRVFTLILVASFCWFHSSIAQKITCTKWQQLVPSDKLPEAVKTQDGNNNLDLARYQDRYYFAFRTAPSHFASDETYIYVVSSDDFEDWRLEKEIHHGNDLREPRFLVYRNKLFLYYFEGGDNALKFEPQHVWVTELQADNTWSKAKNIGLDGYVPWRLRTRNDTIYLSAYYGVGLYSSDHQADLRLFISQNGYDWSPLSEKPQVGGDSGEEGEFAFDEEGNLWGTVRLESKGALIVHADKNSLDQWETKYTKYKYDSALMFRHNNEMYLVSRRNLDGEMGKAPEWLPDGLQKNYNLLRYSLTKKRTALFKLDKETMELHHIMDFPSTGDTAFPAIAKKDENSYILMNYSSDIHGKEKNWIRGQLGETFIYWTVLTFDE